MPGKTPTNEFKVLKPQIRWENLFFYRKSDVVYQMSFVFCDRFIHLYKDCALRAYNEKVAEIEELKKRI